MNPGTKQRKIEIGFFKKIFSKGVTRKFYFVNQLKKIFVSSKTI